jgi:hypothetical protein
MENKVVVIDGERFQKLVDSIDLLRDAVLASSTPVPHQLLSKNPSPLDWMPLEEFCEALGFDKRHFDRYYKKKLKHKKFAHRTFIHKPSLEEWFMKTSI